MNRVPIELLHETFTYLPTGGLVAKGQRRGPQKATAGWVDTSTGYACVRVGGKKMRVHIVAYAMHHGTYPPTGLEIDHIDGNKLNNRIENLRCVSRRDNQHNRNMHRSGRLFGTSKMTDAGGVRTHPWLARHGKKYLGYFATEQEAHAAVLEAEG